MLGLVPMRFKGYIEMCVCPSHFVQDLLMMELKAFTITPLIHIWRDSGHAYNYLVKRN